MLMALMLAQALCSNIVFDVTDKDDDLEIQINVDQWTNTNNDHHSVIVYSEDKNTAEDSPDTSPTDGSPAMRLTFMGSNGDDNLSDNTDFEFLLMNYDESSGEFVPMSDAEANRVIVDSDF